MQVNNRTAIWTLLLSSFFPAIATAQQFGQASTVSYSSYGSSGYDYQGYGTSFAPHLPLHRIPRPYYFGPGSFGTVFESHARGVAALTRARTLAQIDLAVAQSEYEQARRAAIENNVLATRAFLEQRQLRDNFRETADNSFYKSKAKLAAYVAKRQLKPLTAEELDPLTGKISWPTLLELQEHELIRERVNALFGTRAEQDGLSPEESAEASRLLYEWRDQLSAQREGFSQREVVTAARFLGRLIDALKSEIG